MSRNKLLLVASIAALIIGTGGTFAQQERDHNGATNQPVPSVQRNQSSAAQQNRSQQRSQAGQQERRETSGQAPGSNAGTNPSGENRGQTGQADDRRGQATRQTTRQNERGQNERNIPGERSGNKQSTTGQAGPGERRGTDRDRTQTERDRVQSERNENRTTVEGREGRSQTNVNVELSQEQRTRIHDVIVKERAAPRVANVDFSLEVGTRVPRSVHLVRVPSSIIEIEPNWRGFEYFLVGDEIIIVDPRTMEIAAVVLA